MNKDHLLGINVSIFTLMQFTANLGLERPAVIMGWRPEKLVAHGTPTRWRVPTVSKEENALLDGVGSLTGGRQEAAKMPRRTFKTSNICLFFIFLSCK